MGLKAEHQGLHLERVLLRSDHDHPSKEVVFQQRLLAEGMKDKQNLQQSIEYLEQSNKSLLAHTKSLEEARREVLEQVKTEKELLRREEHDALQVKQALDALRDGNGAAASRMRQ